MDYLIITWIRLPVIFFYKIVIIDRYFLDVLINISITLDLNKTLLSRIVIFASKFFPSPTHYIYIDVSPEIAFTRKDDIQSIEYLAERKKLYFHFRNFFDFVVVNGEQKPEDLVNTVRKVVNV